MAGVDRLREAAVKMGELLEKGWGILQEDLQNDTRVFLQEGWGILQEDLQNDTRVFLQED